MGGTHAGNAAKIIKGKGDYVLALKGNQANMLEQVQTFFDLKLERSHSELRYCKRRKRKKAIGASKRGAAICAAKQTGLKRRANGRGSGASAW
ncbi:MAG: hypothetical protein LBS85_02755 [Clostridiales Family XIII bacterium]|nr:hypothetical protein [Clostridiales Family XIII bacterium]